MSEASKPLVAIIMGSRSDWPEVMSHAAKTLDELGIAHEALVMSAHRTPARVSEYASTASARGIEVIIAGAGGAAHLAGVIAGQTQLPVLGVPIASSSLSGLDSLLSIGRAGAVNAALLAAAILALKYPAVAEALKRYRERQTQSILDHPDPREA